MRGNPGGRFSTQIAVGARFGMLEIVCRLPKRNGRYTVLCKCQCGGTATPNVDSLLSGRTKSCGCLRIAAAKESSSRRIVEGVGYGGIVAGAVFGRLTIIGRIQEDGLYNGGVSCHCSCGNDCIRTIDGIVCGNSTSCGCLKAEKTIERNKITAKFCGITSKSGGDRLVYMTWRSMIMRLTNHKHYAGIMACDFLWVSPWNIKATIGSRPTIEHSIDRFPIYNGNYTCGTCEECRLNGWKLNVRWATRKQQSENRGQFNVNLTAFGETKLLSQWSALSGIDGETIQRRLRRGLTVEESITTPDKHGHCYCP